MKALKVAFLWHQHQPYYKWENEFILPWVRLHGVKDYLDLPLLLKKYPSIKQTFNFAPSLMVQIDEYISGKVKDSVQILTEIDADYLSDAQKMMILQKFFVCNEENLIKPYPRFYKLFEKAKMSNYDINAFDVQEFRDLQVWYNLAWIGEISKQKPEIAALYIKGNNFSEEEKRIVMAYHIEILKQISVVMKDMLDSGQVDISCSPEYHPILPLVIDHRSALEAMPWLELSDFQYKYPEDARSQVMQGIDIFRNEFQREPKGVWPSEGSISDATLDLLADANVLWAATDEQILKDTASDDYSGTLKFFPQKYQNIDGTKPINLLFRDQFLSDRIGFVYSSWKPKQAADEFCSHLDSIRNEIVRVHTEDALDYATVTIILDGENCWEFYKENGFPFLNYLYTNLSKSDKFKTVTCSEAAEAFSPQYSKTFSHIRSGSWINANFSIWIGHQHDILAWKMLAKVRKEVEAIKNSLSAELLKEVMREVYIAEGSDWFWWYGPEHIAPNKDDFDILFRYHIRKIYELIGLEAPSDVFVPIGSNDEFQRFVVRKNRITASCNGLVSELNEWDGSAVFNTSGGMSTMHQIGEFVSQMLFGNDDDYLYFRFNLHKSLKNDDSIYLMIDDSYSIKIHSSGLEVTKQNNDYIVQKFTCNESCDLMIKYSKNETKHKIDLKLKTISNNNVIDYGDSFPISYYFV